MSLTERHVRTVADLGWDTWLFVGVLWALALGIAIWTVRSRRKEK